jgi:hypothetical protein
LSQQEAYESITEIFSGKASEVQIAAFLTGLKVKGETVDELEICRRGPCGGAIGYLRFDGRLDTCITIRTAIIQNGLIVGIQHCKLPLFGLQFHPEFILTSYGQDMFKAFLSC